MKKDYNKFGFEDFIQDTAFIRTVQQHPEDIEVFRRETGCVENKDELEKAWKYVKENGLSPDEVDALWTCIAQDTFLKENVHSIRGRHFPWGKIAAFLIVACCSAAFLYYYIKGEEKPAENLGTLMEAYLSNMPVSGENVLLVLSETSRLELNEYTPVITCNEDLSITTGNSRFLTDQQGYAPSYHLLMTPKGKMSHLHLSDGTNIWLNAGTKVLFPNQFAQDRREIFVEGEIYIEVTPDATRPFVVKTQQNDIRVLGTQFDVQSLGAGITRVVLVSGKVSVTNHLQQEEVILSPNQLLEISDRDYTINKVDAQKYVAWKSGVYSYEEESLDKILEDIARYYGVRLIFQQRGHTRYTGKLTISQSFDSLLEGLKNIAPITYIRQDGQCIINIKK